MKIGLRLISAIMVIITIIALFPIQSFAEENVEEISSNDSIFEEYSSIDGEIMSVKNEDEEDVDAAVDTIDIDEETIIENLDAIEDTPESEVFLEEGDIVDGTEEILTDNLSDFVCDEDENPDSVSHEDETDYGYELNATSSYITLSVSSISLNVGKTSKITVGYGGTSEKVKLSCEISNSNIKHSWDKNWINNKLGLSITGVKAGNSTITVFLKSEKNNKVLAKKKITVKITKEVSVSLSKSSLDMVYGKTKTVDVNVSGVDSSMKLKCLVNSKNIASCELKKKITGKYSLSITGKNAGSTKITVNIVSSSGSTLKSKSLTVNVSKNAAISISTTSVTIAPGQKYTNKISYSGAYGSISLKSSTNNSNISRSWSSWSGNSINLYITGKKVGSSTITIDLYNGSNDKLATKKITVTIKENPTLTCSVSSLSLVSGKSQQIKWTYSGVVADCRFECHIENNSICSKSWPGSWTGNTHAMMVSAKNAGKTNMTVYLINRKTNAKLTSKSITVSVTGAPAIELSASSVSFDVGGQKTITATAKNISGTYSISCLVEGTSFSCSKPQLKDNKANITLKGTKSGNGTLTVSLKNSSGTVVSSKKITITVKTGTTPKISLSKSSLKIIENKSEKISVSYSGTTEKVHITCGLSNKIVSVTMGALEKASLPLTVSANKNVIGVSTINIYLKRASDNATLANAKLEIEVVHDIEQLFYSFPNYGTTIQKSIFQKAFGKNTRTERLYSNYKNADGVCYGMASTSMLFNKKDVTTSSFGKPKIFDLKTTDKNTSLGLTVNEFIQLMYVTQFSEECNKVLAKNKNNLNGICNEVANGNIVFIVIERSGFPSHALVGYKLDEKNKKLYVYDCNYPSKDETQFISLTGSSNSYTGWSYNLSQSKIWDNKNATINYQTYYYIKNQWSSRGSLVIPEGYINNSNLLMINSNNFEIYDVDNIPVAKYIDGKLETFIDGVSQVSICGYNIDDESSTNEYNLFYLPSNKLYYVENLDNNIETFKAEMIDEDCAAIVETEADRIGFAVDDDFDLSATHLDIEIGESYDVKLFSSSDESIDDKHLKGVCKDNLDYESYDISFSIADGIFSCNDIGCLSLNSTIDDENVDIIATATTGGTISDLGKRKALKGSNATYEITPDKGYEIGDVIVNGESLGIVDQYTFVQIDEDSTINVVFEKLPSKIKSVSIDDTEVKINQSITVQPAIDIEAESSYNTNWNSSDISVAVVDDNGNISGISEGTAIIECTVTDEFNNAVKDNCVVTVKHGNVTSVSIDDNINMDYKSITNLNPKISFDPGVKYTISYNSSDNKVANVDNKGIVAGKKSFGKKTAIITCTVTDEYGYSVVDSCNVTVGYAWWQWIIGILLLGFIWY